MPGKEKVGKDLVRRSSLSNLKQDMELEVLKQNIFNKHKQMVREIDEKLDTIFDDFLSEVNKLTLNRFEVEKLFNDEKKEVTKPTKKSLKLKAIEGAPSKTTCWYFSYIHFFWSQKG